MLFVRKFYRRHLTVLRWIAAVAAIVCSSERIQAKVAVPSIFGDHMVLQRGVEVPVWGWADPGETVCVTISNQEHETTADADGRWQIRLQPMQVGAPLAMTIEGQYQNHSVTLHDILVGEVWVCSGQSNMQWAVRTSWNADLAIAAANAPKIRLITVATPGLQQPLEDFSGEWQVCSPQTVADFSAVGYYFGQQLLELLDVPIGLIDNAWGGSACEAWVPRDQFGNDNLYGPLLERWKEIEAQPELRQPYDEFEIAWMKWQQDLVAAKKAGQPLPPEPARPPDNRLAAQHRPANLFNGRLSPIVPFAIRGAIWYQGEANASRAYQYRELFPLMIQNWRQAWGQGDFPFYWVQLADYRDEKPQPVESDWAELREAQTLTIDRLPNTGQAVIIDIGEGSDIHPRNKLEVAKRLARLALSADYGLPLACQSPRYRSMKIQDGKVELVFDHQGGGLRTVDDKRIEGFAIAGEDRQWHWAEAAIKGRNQVEVWSEQVPEPVAVRYAWADNPVCNLYSAEGLPVTPFRTDDWPGVTSAAR